MKYCRFHPAEAASWYCPRCCDDTCDTCTDESVNMEKRHCFQCGGPLESLGAAYTAEPFWEHLQAIFRYPFTWPAMSLIVVVSLVGMVLSFFPLLGALAVIISAGVLIKYCFRCLEETAMGDMVPPDITSAYSGGILIIFKMIFLLIVVGGIIGAAEYYLGSGIASLLMGLVMLSTPAFLINYATTDDLFGSASPINVLRIILAIGLPYGLLIGLLMLMSSSVSFLMYFMFIDAQWLTTALISIVSNYYLVVMFHLMGYVVFQYQRQLGFSAREASGEVEQQRSESERLRAQISVLVKSGEYSKALHVYRRVIERHRNDLSLQDEFFEFLCQTSDREHLQGFVDGYFELKTEKGYLDQLRRIYRQVRTLLPNYVPADGEVRYQLAKQFADLGEFAATVHLINGMHKVHTDLSLLIKSYSVLEQALEGLEKDELAEACRGFLQKLRARAGVTTKVDEASLDPGLMPQNPMPHTRVPGSDTLDIETTPDTNSEHKTWPAFSR